MGFKNILNKFSFKVKENKRFFTLIDFDRFINFF